jgi:uncharacterized protein YacL
MRLPNPTITCASHAWSGTEGDDQMNVSKNSGETSAAIIFVEGFRLLFVLGGSVVGFEIGRSLNTRQIGPVVGLLLGATTSYVIGGVAGRLLDKGLQQAVFSFRNTPPGEAFAASIIATAGMLLGLVIGLPLFVLLRNGFALIITAAITWVLASLGWRVGSVKGRQVVAAAGLSRVLAPPTNPPEGHALLPDATAIMDRFLLVLGRGGLLPAGLVIPQFVVDQLRSVAASSDPAGSRRARRGLESLEALREMSVPVHISPDEIPEVDDPTTKLLTLARRLGLRIGTCSSVVVDEANRWELPVVDLRDMANGLTPDHLPGEHLQIDLIREGRQPRQAVGYLPDGDMLVVNDALHMIGEGVVDVTVLSTRSTSQGLMVFAELSEQGVPTASSGQRRVRREPIRRS